MYINDKEKILTLLNTVIEALDYCIDSGDGWEEYVDLSIEALEAIHAFIAKKDAKINLDIIQEYKDVKRYKSNTWSVQIT